jgi:hypothetical protein
MIHELEPTEAPFWHLDEELGELELEERPSGPDVKSVRLKAHTESGPYQSDRELYPLAQHGTKHEMSGRAYILVPNLTFTAGVYPEVEASGPIGEVTSFSWEGMRHHDIASVRGF